VLRTTMRAGGLHTSKLALSGKELSESDVLRAER
jgi:hypothetical protein